VEACGCQDHALTRGQALDLGGRREHGQQVFTHSTDHKSDAELSPVAVVTPRVRLHCVCGHVVAIDDSNEAYEWTAMITFSRGPCDWESNRMAAGLSSCCVDVSEVVGIRGWVTAQTTLRSRVVCGDEPLLHR